MKTVPFNINHYVKVRLTECGLRILKENHADFCKRYSKIPWGEFKPPKMDEDGWSSYQAWHLMSTFGPHMGLSSDPPFETDILIQIDDETILGPSTKEPVCFDCMGSGFECDNADNVTRKCHCQKDQS